MGKFISSITTLLLTGIMTLGMESSILASASQSEETEQTATTQEVVLQNDSLDFLLPNSYEQYLPLSNISDVAVKKGYIAVAEGNNIYLYNGEEYTVYTYDSVIVQLEFISDLTLYFLDETGNLYTMNCQSEQPKAEKAGVICSAFTLTEDTYYYALSVTGSTRIWDKRYPAASVATLNSASTTVPVMHYAENKLYYTDGVNLIAYNGDGTENYQLGVNIFDITVRNGVLYYTNKDKLYTYDLHSRTSLASYSIDGLAYTALCEDGDILYVVALQESGVKICTFDMVAGKFTDYEIGSSSKAENRLSNGVNSLVCGNYLLTIDDKRLSLYDRKNKTFSVTPLGFAPTLIASDGKSILLSDSTFVMAFDYAGNQLMNQHWISTFGTITGITSSGGNYYLSTASNIFVKFSAQTFTPLANEAKTMNYTAHALSSDIYGNLYVMDSAGNVYCYTEEEFVSKQVNRSIYTFGPAFNRLAVDLDCNLYSMNGDSVYCSNGNTYTPDPLSRLFRADQSLRTFTFGYETNTVYFLYKDFILSSNIEGLPNLAQLEVANSYENIFVKQSNEVVSVVEIDKNAVLLTFDMSAMTKDGEFFPACSYTRTSAKQKAVVLTSTNIHGSDYYVISLSDDGKKYRSGLVLTSFCTKLSTDEYLTVPDPAVKQTGYTCNNVSLYKYPYMEKELTLGRLEKGTAMQLLGNITLNEKYYYVGVETENGVVLGYLPERFVSLIDVSYQTKTQVRFATIACAEPVIATSEQGKQITLSPDKYYAVTLRYNDKENTATIVYTVDNETYYATTELESITFAQSDMLRIFAILLLLLLDLGIVVNYIYYRKR